MRKLITVVLCVAWWESEIFVLASISNAQIHRVIQSATKECRNVAGLGVAVVSRKPMPNGSAANVTFTKGYGLRSVEDGIPADDKTFLCIGSLTKHITATLLVHLLHLLRREKHLK